MLSWLRISENYRFPIKSDFPEIQNNFPFLITFKMRLGFVLFWTYPVFVAEVCMYETETVFYTGQLKIVVKSKVKDELHPE